MAIALPLPSAGARASGLPDLNLRQSQTRFPKSSPVAFWNMAPVTQFCILSFWSREHFQNATRLLHANTFATTRNTSQENDKEITFRIKNNVQIKAHVYLFVFGGSCGLST